MLDALEEHDATAVGFVNDDKLLAPGLMDENVLLLQAWLDAGMELGNHTFGHVGMHETDVATMEAAVLKGETISGWLSQRANRPYRYFRHPFTQTGNTVGEKIRFERFLASQGYIVAPFTIEHTDYLYSCVYDHLSSGLAGAGIAPEALADEYLQHLDDSLDAFETMSEELFGRQVPQVWLIHANRINADTLGRSLALLESRGYEFVTLEAALQDPAYAIDTAPSKRFGPSWLLRWARALGRKLSVYGQPEPSARVASAYRASCEG